MLLFDTTNTFFGIRRYGPYPVWTLIWSSILTCYLLLASCKCSVGFDDTAYITDFPTHVLQTSLNPIRNDCVHILGRVWDHDDTTAHSELGMVSRCLPSYLYPYRPDKISARSFANYRSLEGKQITKNCFF